MGKVKTAVYICVFILVWAQLVLPLIPGYAQNIKLQDFSLYNTAWNGCFMLRIELTRNGYDVRPLLSSLSILSRAEGTTVVILAPSSFINPLEAIQLADFVRKGGGLLIADDFGTGNIFTMLLFYSLGLPSPQFWNAPLLGSYTGGVSTWTYTPAVTEFNTSHPIFKDVRQIILNWPTALWNVPPENQAAALSPAFIDMNRNGQMDPLELLPSATVVAVYDLESMGFEVGGQNVSYGKGRIVVVSDPSIFNNDMLLRGDNLRFAINIIDWLSRRNEGGESNLVVFDEAHLAAPYYYSYGKLFGSILGYIDWASANWFLAPIYPALIVFSIWRWLPRGKPKEMGPTAVYLKRGKTFLTERLEWYKENKQYGYALKLLYRRMKRHLVRRFKLKEYSVDAAVRVLSDVVTAMRRTQLKRFLEEWEAIERGEKPIYMNSETFLNHFFVMKKIMEAVMVEKRG
ncbi:MAG: DUF4350 domain-containing protein [Candidatus Freyarchaeota archaeon]|nr:DUF4350 domain-containing protein [Candidatus Jordarchaeia archaeon]